MHQWGLRPTLIYNYFLPELPMVESYLRYVEDRIGRQVYRFPSKICMEFLVNGLLQLPSVGARVSADCNEAETIIPSTHDLNRYILDCFPKDTYLSVGLRVSDGIFRARRLRQFGAIHPDRKEWYPVADCLQSDIVRIIGAAKWKLPFDYRLFGRSFESIRHWTAGPIRDQCPKTWAYICSIYPMAKLLPAQEELLDTAGRHIKARITSFSHLAFRNEDCTA